MYDAVSVGSTDKDAAVRRIELAVGVVFLGFASGAAVAQGTLGELLDAGAVKLSKQQVLETVIGANVSGRTRAGGTQHTDYKSDGTYSGSYAGTGIYSAGYFGKWTLDDTGKLCIEGQAGLKGTPSAGCVCYYRLADQLYIGPDEESNRSGSVLMRTVKR